MQSGITRRTPGYSNPNWSASLPSASDVRLTGASALDVFGGGGMQGIGSNASHTAHSKATMNAEVTFEKGHEHYSGLTVDGKP